MSATRRQSWYPSKSLGVGVLVILLTAAAAGCEVGGSSGADDAPSAEGASRVPPIDLLAPDEVRTATFGFGCFWGAEARMGVVDGVVRTRVGYSGGTTPDPTYYELGDHTESVQVDYDPNVVSYQELLDVFFAGHDCSIGNADRQYMSVIFFHDAEQETAAMVAKAEMDAKTDGAVVTQILPAGPFYLAEEYHQKYELQKHESLMGELRAAYPDFTDLIDSTAAARLNGYVYGVGDPAQLRRELESLGLSDQASEDLLSLVDREAGL